MRYAMIKGGKVIGLVELQAGDQPYVPPAGVTLREATAQDEQDASKLPGYVPPNASG